jgi:hypothetical protein
MTSLRSASILALALAWLPGKGHAAVSPEWAEKWRADLAFAADTMPQVHPNLFHTVSRERFRAELDSLRARLATLDHQEIVVELARIVALVGDGHTRLTLPFDSAAGFFTGHSRTPEPVIPGLVFRSLPLRLRVFEDGVFVVAATSEHRRLLGGRVVELGQRTIEQAIAAVEPTIQRDNRQQVLDLLPTWLVVPEILHARGATREMDRVRVVVEGSGGGRREVSLAPMPPGRAPQWASACDAGDPPAVDRRPERAHWVERLPDVPVLYARFREVLDQEGRTVEAFAAEVMQGLSHEPNRSLVLDLRGNVGGNGFLNRPLLHGLLASSQARRPAGLFVVADRGTFSAATMLLADLETHTSAVLAGETSGGAPNGYGDSRRVRLPRTGLTVRVSTLYWQMTDPRDRRDGIPPLIEVPTRFADWRANRDPVLDSLVVLARGGGEVAGTWRGTMAIGSGRLQIGLSISPGPAPVVRVDAPALGVKEGVGEVVGASSDSIAFTLRLPDGTLRFRARAAGETLIGQVGFQGSRLAFVARREPGS